RASAGQGGGATGGNGRATGSRGDPRAACASAPRGERYVVSGRRRRWIPPVALDSRRSSGLFVGAVPASVQGPLGGRPCRCVRGRYLVDGRGALRPGAGPVV